MVVGRQCLSRALCFLQEAPVPIAEKVGWHPVLVRLLWRIEHFSPLGFVPRTAHHVSSCLIDCGVPAQFVLDTNLKLQGFSQWRHTRKFSCYILCISFCINCIEKIFQIVYYLKIIIILTMKDLYSGIWHRCKLLKLVYQNIPERPGDFLSQKR